MSVPRITIKDVAREAGVSVATVSFVMNDKGNLPEATRLRVREVCDRLGYKTNRRAANLRTGKSRTIGFIIPELRNEGWVTQWYELIGQAILGVSQAASARGYAVVIVPPNSPDLMLEFGLDAVALNDSQIDDPDITRAHSLGIPIVTQDRPHDSRISVHLDTGYAAMTTAALEALRERGARHVALLTEPGGATSNTTQVAAFLTWCETHGYTPTVVRGAHDRSDLVDRVNEILGSGADALYSFYGEGEAIVAQLREQGYDVPHDFQVIALRAAPAGVQHKDELSTTTYHPELYTGMAIGTTLDVVEGKLEAPQTVHVPWRLELAETTRNV